jgi:hypothetical protein
MHENRNIFMHRRQALSDNPTRFSNQVHEGRGEGQRKRETKVRAWPQFRTWYLPYSDTFVHPTGDDGGRVVFRMEVLHDIGQLNVLRSRPTTSKTNTSRQGKS